MSQKVFPQHANYVPGGATKAGGSQRPPGVPPWANYWAGSSAPVDARPVRRNAPPPKKHKLKARKAAREKAARLAQASQESQTDTGIENEPEDVGDEDRDEEQPAPGLTCKRCEESFDDAGKLRVHRLRCPGERA